ncbi:putative oxidoreductase [Rosa chinensis]|uniref:glyoxylate reductase (NADP(+)) n=1 Tax=Rosa chinensis TaxID=74649 RepID=A0A2P6SGC0_ROSCH|nr:glyoxylate/hydroxypyruvate reductase HPR3 [Rosa chinensis]PRQ57733.1 putative oxidoreductase [Rosa chinensis]
MDQQLQNLPDVLIIKPPPAFISFESDFTQKFNILRAWESPLPLDQFLTTHAQSVQALLCRAVTPVNADLLQMLPALKLVVTVSTGANHVDKAECRRRGIAVANARNVYSEDVADIAVGLFIDVNRRISAADWYVRRGLWSSKGDYPLGSKIGGKRVGIVGLGSIGYEVAKRLEAFGCKISYNSRSERPSLSYPFYSNVCELAANNDALIICCALTDQTRHMINKEVLSALGKDGVIVNIGRGAIIDEKELVKCLVNGEIRGAGLDVFENEPHIPKELMAMDNVVLSPHKSVYTLESFKRGSEVMIANLEAFFSNKPLITPVYG